MSTSALPNSQAIFYQQYSTVRRDEIVGVLLALFLGAFGIHHFYLRRTGLGVLYCVFCWTGIPSLLGFIECFFMPARVREFNAIQAAAIAANLGIAVPGWDPSIASMPPPFVPAAQPFATAMNLTCAHCQTINPAGARFCSACGNALENFGGGQ